MSSAPGADTHDDLRLIAQVGSGELPVRPSLPLPLWTLVCVVGCEHIALAGDVSARWAVAFALGALACAGAAWRRASGDRAMPSGEMVRADPSGEGRRERVADVLEGALWPLAACFAACALALGASALYAAHGAAFVDAMLASPVSNWRLEAVSDSSRTEYGWSCRARASRDGAPTGEVWLQTDGCLMRGEVLVAVGRFSPADGSAWGATSAARGIWGSVRVVRVLSRSRVGGVRALPLMLRMQAREAIGPERSAARALLAGCVLADRSALQERGLSELFSTCGVAHLVAVSGAHIAIVAGVVEGVLRQGRTRPAVRAVATLAASGLFVLVCGAPPSAVRAYLMSASASLSTLAGRRVDSASSAALAGTVMALVDPGLSGELGFSLSVGCVVGLALFGSYATYALAETFVQPPLSRHIPEKVRMGIRQAQGSAVSALAAALVCQTASAPLALPVFGKVSLVGPLAALVMTAPIGAMMTFGLVACCLAWAPVLPQLFLKGSDVCADVALMALRRMARLPYTSISVQVDEVAAWCVAILLGALLYLWWPRVIGRRVRSALACLVAVMLAVLLKWRYFAPARICVLDVGQGDAILVQDGASALLVDVGPDASVLVALAREQVLHLDAVVLTHLHADHVGGLDELVAALPCERVFVAQGVAPQVDGELAQAVGQLPEGVCEELGYADTLRVGDFELTMVWPRTEVTGDENADSIEFVVRYERGGRTLSALLTGDAEWEQTGAVIAAGDVGDIDLLKVGHHGSAVSITEAQATSLAPEVAVASAGEGNSYGHPRAECAQALEGAGATFLCTKDVGDVEVRPGSAGPEVRYGRR